MSKTYSAGIVTAYGAAKRAGYQGTYEDFCRQQAGYAESAATVEQAKNTAVSAANTATTKAGEATTAATAAQTAKTQTEAAASQALTDIGTAGVAAVNAVHTEGATQTANATAQAQAAAQSATTASTKADEASASATSAGQSATNAAASATSAAQSASNAQDVLDSIPADYSDLSEDVDQLKADLDAQAETINGLIVEEAITPTLKNGTFATTSGVITSATNRVVSELIHLGKDDRITVKRNTTNLMVIFGVFNSSQTSFSCPVSTSWQSSDVDWTATDECYFLIQFKTNANEDITPSDINASFEVFISYRRIVDKNTDDIENLNESLGGVSAKVDYFIQRYYKSNNISQIPNVTKLAGYSFGTSGTKVSGAVSATYDSYWFYTDVDTALYFDNVAPSSPAYIAVTVGYVPTKNWIQRTDGTLQMDCSSAIRKRKSESNLPVSTEPLDVSEAIVIFTVNASTTTDVYINNGLELQDEVLFNQAQINQVIESIPPEHEPVVKCPKLIYTTVQEFEDEKSTEQINIFLPTTYGYIRYAFGHSVYADINANSWRIFRAISADENMDDRFHITAYGEWEMALKIDGSTDFMGGVLHGDEVMEDVTFFIDGEEIDISTLVTLTDFSELRIVENTLLYNPDVANENVAQHSKEYIFTADGVTINQRVKWLMAKTLTTSYSCMFPLIRGNDAVSELQITANYYDDNDYKTYDISVGGMSGYPFTWHNDVTRANFWAEDSGIFASAEIVKQPPVLTGGGKSFLQNTVNQYNKLYFSICGIGTTYTVSANETWRWSQRYTISAIETN